MQIQRIQSVFLLLAVICIAVMMFMPVVKFTSIADPTLQAVVKPTGELALAIPMALTGLLLFLDIFLYNDLRLQRRVLLFSMLFTILNVFIVAFIVFNGVEGFTGEIAWWSYMFLVVLLFEMLAKRGIDHDRDLLESANRLR